MCSRPELFQIPAGFGYTNDRDIQMSTLDHTLQRREYFLIGQIARRTEEYQRVRVQIVHKYLLQPMTFRLLSPGAHRIHTAWRTRACPRNQLRLVTQIARTEPRSEPAPALPHQLLP